MGVLLHSDNLGFCERPNERTWHVSPNGKFGLKSTYLLFFFKKKKKLLELILVSYISISNDIPLVAYIGTFVLYLDILTIGPTIYSVGPLIVSEISP